MNLEPSSQLNLFSHKEEFHKLINLYKNNNLPNKILFSGEKGIGKCTLAYHLINYILSSNEDFIYDLDNLKIIPDNKSFKLVQNKSNPNFILVDIQEEKKNIDIGQIRNLILTLNKSSFNNKPRFVLIDNIELLNINAVNALLKILEEPNDNINFILINNNKRILPTLKSRCLNFKIQLTSKQSIEIANKILNNNYNEFLN
ncbi:AAA family ATPase, partial [Candidatus Pelagibacter sp.]|nr:AAA family ATPase [Candidatus Pelagibacter sp.]